MFNHFILQFLVLLGIFLFTDLFTKDFVVVCNHHSLHTEFFSEHLLLHFKFHFVVVNLFLPNGYVLDGWELSHHGFYFVQLAR
jgi:hypothetical protein